VAQTHRAVVNRGSKGSIYWGSYIGRASGKSENPGGGGMYSSRPNVPLVTTDLTDQLKFAPMPPVPPVLVEGAPTDNCRASDSAAEVKRSS
jgi:hypothetical protein